MDEPPRPQTPPALIVVPMPADTNAGGSVFGGWILAQMDIAGAVAAHARVRGRIVTAGADRIAFHRPVQVGDVVAFHAGIARVGRSSVTIGIDVWSRRADSHEERVASGRFTYVHIDADRRPTPITAPN